MKVWVRMQFHWPILYTLIRSCALLYDLGHFYVIFVHSHTIPNAHIRSQAKHLYLFLTHNNFTNPKHLKIYQPFLNYHKNMWSLSVHPNHYKKNYFFFIQYKKRKMPSLSTKERKAKLRVAIKEFNDELLNLVTIQDKLEKNYPINEQQVAEIDELYMMKYGSLMSQLKI